MHTSAEGLFSLMNTSSVLQEYMALYGYEYHETPMVDLAELFLTKSGDAAMTKLVSFDHRGRNLALRPEFTAGAVQSYVDLLISGATEPKRWQYSGYVFEDHTFSQSKYYQRYSVGAELLGVGGSFADAEIIAMAMLGLKRIGYEDVTLALGHVGLVRLLMRRFNLDSRTEHFLFSSLPALKDSLKGVPYVLETFDRLVQVRSEEAVDDEVGTKDAHDMVDMMLGVMQRSSTMGGRSREDIARRLVSKNRRAGQRDSVVEALKVLQELALLSGSVTDVFGEMRHFVGEDQLVLSVLDECRQSIDFLSAYGISMSSIVFSPALLRSLDYYTGMVFELLVSDGSVLAGGGRYDGLLGLLSDKPSLPAVGFAYYMDRFERLGMTERIYPVVLLVSDYTKSTSAIEWASALRHHDISIFLDPDGDRLPSEYILLDLTDEDKITYNKQSFSKDQIDQLVHCIRQGLHE